VEIQNDDLTHPTHMIKPEPGKPIMFLGKTEHPYEVPITVYWKHTLGKLSQPFKTNHLLVLEHFGRMDVHSVRFDKTKLKAALLEPD